VGRPFLYLKDQPMKLKPAVQPEWQTPCEGLRVLMRPVGTPVMVEARHLFSELGVAETKATGAETVDLSRVRYLMTVALFAAAAVEWDGLEDEDGTALPKPDVGQVKRLLDGEAAIYEWFDTEHAAPFYLLLAEKKGSGRSQSGTSPKAGQATAGDAKDDTVTPKAPAPMKKTPRKPRKAA